MNTKLLRLALKLDAVATGGLGLLAVAAAPLLENLLGAPRDLLTPVGAFLIAYGVAVWVIGTRATVSRTAVWAVIALNLVWVLDSVLTVAAGWLSLTVLGTGFVLLQAAAVALFADLQFMGLRRARAAA